MDDRGDQRLEEEKLEDVFTFEVAQTENSEYGADYFLGDLATAINPFTQASGTYKITQVTITNSPEGEEEIAIEVTKQ